MTVYCRRHHATAGHEWRGVHLVTLPTIRHKYLDTVVHSTLSAVHLITRTRIRDVVLCNAANAPVLPLLRSAGRRVVMNVDGLEWRRGKWGVLGRSWYRMGEWLSVRSASVLVTDAAEVRTYYRVRHDTDSVMVPYGTDLPRAWPAASAGDPRDSRRVCPLCLSLGAGEQPAARGARPCRVRRLARIGDARASDVRRRSGRRGSRGCLTHCRDAGPDFRSGVHGAAEQCPVLCPRDRGRRYPSRADRGDGGREPLPGARHAGEP